MLHLSAYNNILSQTGPISRSDLLQQVRVYSILCRMDISPEKALEGLLEVGALIRDIDTDKISIPDQMSQI